MRKRKSLPTNNRLLSHITSSPSHVTTGPDNKSFANSPTMSKNQLSYTDRTKQPMTLVPEEYQIIPARPRPMLPDLLYMTKCSKEDARSRCSFARQPALQGIEWNTMVISNRKIPTFTRRDDKEI
ncbi:hypothetical protein E4U61_007883 [Claviceps capensis]|nr:hypothetical protein E4U61_007883 [Claviceps capensis]